jgi:hypothetical protein
MRATGFLFGSSLSGLILGVSGCLTNVPDPALGGVYACEVQEDCPESLSCLQKVCEAAELPIITIVNPEEQQPYPFGTVHDEFLNISGVNFVLRPLAESNDAVPGEGHIVVFLDGEEIATVDNGDLTGGVGMPISIPDTPGAHRIHAQARFNDGTNYDNEGAVARRLVWVDNGRKHVALRSPWPGDSFPVDAFALQAEVAVFDPLGIVEIGPPMTGKQHVHVYYNKTFPDCFLEPICYMDYEGVVPSDDSVFGPVFLPSAGAGPAVLTATIMEADHSIYYDEMDQPVFSEIPVLRTNN